MAEVGGEVGGDKGDLFFLWIFSCSFLISGGFLMMFSYFFGVKREGVKGARGFLGFF